MEPSRTELHLHRHADTAWSAVIRPWLEEGRGRLTRSYVVVPTRGQAQGLKQRCMMEGLALFGVEFLTPGLARKKWLALGVAGETRPVLGRELLLLGLMTIIERRLARLTSEQAVWGLLKSLQSDPERALDDFDELLKAGFGAEDFGVEMLSAVFGELDAWATGLGYEFGPRQSRRAALAAAARGGEKRIDGRLLIYGLSAEIWGELFNVAAFARCFGDVVAVLPEPEFRGRKTLDEAWIERWEKLLGASPLPIDALERPASCEAVAAVWTGAGEGAAADAEAESADSTRSRPQPRGEAARATVIVGRTRVDEMELVADEITGLLARRAENIGVIFPKSDAAHLRLATALATRGIVFADMLETAGATPVEIRLQRALVTFYERGARLEEFLEIWPLLRTLGLVDQPLSVARDVCERLFDEGQTHALAAYAERLAASERPEWREVARVAALVLPAWTDELTLGEALKRFAEIGAKFGAPAPAGWAALEAFAERETQRLPAKVVFAALSSFLPEKGPAAEARGRGVFARVTLTTRRRAEGVAWSHLILVEANAGVWPERREPSCWLTDERRAALAKSVVDGEGLFTGDDRAALDKNGYAALVRDTRVGVVFSAALFDEEEPELRLAPNAWLERVLWSGGYAGAEDAAGVAVKADLDLEKRFEQLARTASVSTAETRVGEMEKASDGVAEKALADWFEVWTGRREAGRPFDEYFFSANPARVRPGPLAARLIERAVSDPAELWFEGVLGVTQTEWRPLVRAPRKALGQLAHRALALALRGPLVEGRFGEMPKIDDARWRLAAELEKMRRRWPADRYWESFAAELGSVAAALLENVFALPLEGKWVAVELALPAGASVPVDAAGGRQEVRGRVDLLLADRPEWRGARVDIVDFKTGGDAKLSAAAMGRSGASLQLGVYLAAAQSLGAEAGRVWMVKPEEDGGQEMTMEELPVALAKLGRIGRHIASGRYGALTKKRSEYVAAGFAWPLACAPVAEAVLAAKFAATFGVEPEADAEAEGNAEGGSAGGGAMAGRGDGAVPDAVARIGDGATKKAVRDE